MSAKKNHQAPKASQRRVSRKHLNGEQRQRLLELSKLVKMGVRHMLSDFFRKPKSHIISHGPIAEEAQREVRALLGR